MRYQRWNCENASYIHVGGAALRVARRIARNSSLLAGVPQRGLIDLSVVRCCSVEPWTSWSALIIVCGNYFIFIATDIRLILACTAFPVSIKLKPI